MVSPASSIDLPGYQQVYIVKRKTSTAPEHNEVFFQCGQWCYDGFVTLDLGEESLTIQDLSSIPRKLHKQQTNLSFLCLTDNVMSQSMEFAPALRIIQDANSFIVDELGSPQILEAVQRNSNSLGDTSQFEDRHFFEFVARVSEDICEFECICCKTYIKQTMISIIFFEGIFYCSLRDASDDQPLLDISFPDVSREGNGVNLKIYNLKEQEKSIKWEKLSLWQSVPIGCEVFGNSSINPTVSLSSCTYGQSYCILKPNRTDQSIRDVLFKFGSWCYSGEAELIAQLTVDDVPHIIPALRKQQHKLVFLYHASEMSTDNLFTRALIHMSQINKLMEGEIIASEDALERLHAQSILDKEEDPKNLFYQFETVSNDVLDKSNVECIATKNYHPNGLVVMNIYFQGTFYVCLNSGDENQPLLDSNFPSINNGGKGYNLKKYPSGIVGFPELRKLSLWRNLESEEAKKEIDVKEPYIGEKEVIGKPGENKQSSQRQHSTFDDCEPKPSGRDLFNVEVNKTLRQIRQKKKKHTNLGAFHYCPPLKKPSQLEECSKVRKTSENYIGSQWGRDGRPLNTSIS